MRRLVASALIVAWSSLASGCGLLEPAAEPRSELGALRTVTGKGFEIELPCSAAERKETRSLARGLRVTLHSWTCEADDVAYSVSTAKFPDGFPLDLDGGAQGAADAVDGTVVSNTKVRFGGLPGRDVDITATHEGEPARAFLRVLLRQRTLIQVQVVVSGDEADPPATYRKVLRSLVVT